MSAMVSVALLTGFVFPTLISVLRENDAQISLVLSYSALKTSEI